MLTAAPACPPRPPHTHGRNTTTNGTPGHPSGNGAHARFYPHPRRANGAVPSPGPTSRMWSAAGGNRTPAPGAGLREEPRASEYEESTEGSPGEGERVLGGGAPVTGVPRSAAPRGDAGRCRREGGAGPAQPLGRPPARPAAHSVILGSRLPIQRRCPSCRAPSDRMAAFSSGNACRSGSMAARGRPSPSPASHRPRPALGAH